MILPSKGENDYDYIVDCDRTSIKNWLAERHAYSSRLLRRIKQDGRLTKNGLDCYLIDEVQEGDRLAIRLPEDPSPVTPVAGKLDIIYEDDEVLVVNKPADLVTHQTKSHQLDTLANLVAAHWQETGTVAVPRFLNRLDRDTSGLVVIAKNKYVHHFVQSQMGTDAIHKVYTAFIKGVPTALEGTISAPIARTAPDSITRMVSPKGKPACTHYRVLEAYGALAARVELVLETGRTHQLRVHLNYLGHPILGDPLYGSGDPDEGIGRQALHARELTLSLPKSGERHFVAPLSADLLALEKSLASLKGQNPKSNN